MRWSLAKIAALVAVMGCAVPVVPMEGQGTLAEELERSEPFRTGAEQLDRYLPLLKGKRIGVVTNATGIVGERHLVDTLLARGVNVIKVYAPEHGFRGDADAGELVKDGKDARTGLPIISLYGKNKKPTAEQIADVDILLFDIQDVGVRFYTYTGTLHYVMEAAAESGKEVVVLDRPNPNGFYMDGNILDTAFRSFVGMHPVPIVHGMTIGEYGAMINGEGWLAKGLRCNYTVIPCSGYTRNMVYDLPVRPSPNLPNATSILLYPHICLFEGTPVSLGRGTDTPFQVVGMPGVQVGDYSFTPEPRPGAKDPPQKGKLCQGFNLTGFDRAQAERTPGLHLDWLLTFYKAAPDKEKFFTKFFDTLAGGTELRKAIQAGKTADAIRKSWEPGLAAFSAKRKPYLLYP